MKRRPVAVSWPELAALHAWMREAQCGLTFRRLADRAVMAGRPVGERTLRRAFDAPSLPTEKTISSYAWAWASKNGVDGRVFEKRGLDLLVVARHTAPSTAVPVWPPPSHVPGRVSTWEGLTRALNRIHAQAERPSLRALAASAGAAGRLSKSTISNILRGERRPSAEQLSALLAAYGAGPETTAGMLAAHRRIPAGPRGPAVYPCEVVERAEEQAEDRRQREETRRKLLYGTEAGNEHELDEYDQRLRDEEEAAFQRQVEWVDSLSADEFEALQGQAAAGSGLDLRAELAAYVAQARPGA
ncbi:helix-turn-helix domain-containing protein [Streptomyces cathayae]|uniref:Helix-turn-helix transcriptional regulator n=1 Tax=Streptomyces cathayae TaxID=3031124 RepID=A0ABY8KFD4_9ACTN|nr:helix-turn-helix transcriptional regulator [Streptomyces sp. HUAS 5]WGD45133.1 helix-turn-helix transcriptional regulator [Streptomyces sp. HUAS 5]